MIEALRAVVQYRDLLYMITWRDIRIKYKQSIMGFLWALLMPMIIVSAGIVVKVAFSYLSDVPLERQDVIAISAKSVCWAFFVASIRFASNSLVLNPNLVTKIYFPRIVFPVSAVLSQLFDFAIASAVLVVVLVPLGVGFSFYYLWIPVMLAILILFVTGLGVILSAGSLFFRDVKYIVEVILTFAIFFTPVFYEAEMFGRWASIIMLNPVAPILEGMYRVVALHESPDLLWLLYSAVVGIGIALAALPGFAKLEPLFAEKI